jgi:hypothetical protein
VSRWNGFRHGLRAELPLLPDESADDLAALRESLIAELSPGTVLEAELVDRIVTQIWRLRRVYRMETGVLLWHEQESRLDDLDADAMRLGAFMLRFAAADEGSSTPYGPLRVSREGAPALGRAVLRDSAGSDALSKLSRYEMRLSRGLARDLFLLNRLRHAGAT